MTDQPLDELERSWISTALSSAEVAQCSQLPAKIVRELNSELFTFGPNYEVVVPEIEALISYINTSGLTSPPFSIDTADELSNFSNRVQTVIALKRYRRIADGEVSPPHHPCANAMKSIVNYLESSLPSSFTHSNLSIMLGACLALVGEDFYGQSLSIEPVLTETRQGVFEQVITVIELLPSWTAASLVAQNGEGF